MGEGHVSVLPVCRLLSRPALCFCAVQDGSEVISAQPRKSFRRVWGPVTQGVRGGSMTDQDLGF